MQGATSIQSSAYQRTSTTQNNKGPSSPTTEGLTATPSLEHKASGPRAQTAPVGSGIWHWVRSWAPCPGRGQQQSHEDEEPPARINPCVRREDRKSALPTPMENRHEAVTAAIFGGLAGLGVKKLTQDIELNSVYSALLVSTSMVSTWSVTQKAHRKAVQFAKFVAEEVRLDQNPLDGQAQLKRIVELANVRPLNVQGVQRTVNNILQLQSQFPGQVSGKMAATAIGRLTLGAVEIPSPEKETARSRMLCLMELRPVASGILQAHRRGLITGVQAESILETSLSAARNKARVSQEMRADINALQAEFVGKIRAEAASASDGAATR